MNNNKKMDVICTSQSCSKKKKKVNSIRFHKKLREITFSFIPCNWWPFQSETYWCIATVWEMHVPSDLTIPHLEIHPKGVVWTSVKIEWPKCSLKYFLLEEQLKTKETGVSIRGYLYSHLKWCRRTWDDMKEPYLWQVGKKAALYLQYSPCLSIY